MLAAITLRIEPRAGMTIDEYITAAGAEHSGPAEVARVSEAIPAVKLVLNLCLLGVERGVWELPLDARAGKRRRRARSDGRMARLAARDAHEVVIQDLDLILRATSPATDGIDGLGGHRQRMHQRRGHWKMQAYGPGAFPASRPGGVSGPTDAGVTGRCKRTVRGDQSGGGSSWPRTSSTPMDETFPRSPASSPDTGPERHGRRTT